MTHTKTAAVVLFITIFTLTGCGTDSGDSEKKESKTKPTKVGKTANNTASAASQAELLNELSEDLGDGAKYESFDKSLQSEDEAQLEKALQELVESDTSFIKVGSKPDALEIPCADGTGRVSIMVFDDWKGNGDSIIGVASSTSFAGFAEKGGEDYGWVVASCKDGNVGEQTLAPPDMLKSASNEKVEDSMDEAVSELEEE